MAMTPSELIEALQFRYATKTFDPSRTIPEESWTALEESLRLTPSSFGLQPWRFLVIQSPEIRASLRTASWNQSQITDASHLVVFTARADLNSEDIDRWINCCAAAQNKSREQLAGLHQMISGYSASLSLEARKEWNIRQVYIALGQFMASAANLRIDTCPLEGLSREKYDEILGLSPTGYQTVCACAAGYRLDSDNYALMPKARFPLDQVVHQI